MSISAPINRIEEPAFTRIPGGIDGKLLERAIGLKAVISGRFDGIGDVYSVQGSRLLGFLSDAAFIGDANANVHIAGMFCAEEHRAKMRQDIECIVVPDAKFCFFSLMDFLAREFHVPFENQRGTACMISERATIAARSVRIGNNVSIEPGAYVGPGTIIGNDVIVRANATVGVDGFQHQRTSQGIISPSHDGMLFVEDGVEIGYGASVSRGFSYRATRIRARVKIDALAYVAHGAEIGAETIVCTHASVMGHVRIGAKAWLGPQCVVTNRIEIGEAASVSPGAVVTTDVPAGARYSGNFAIPHQAFIADLKAKSRSSE